MDTSYILSFLKDLKVNNNRDWFEKNKGRYKESAAYFLELVEAVVEGIGEFDEDISLLEPKKCIYRIYRDVRFSKDKTPYKTHFGADMAPGGRKSGLAGYYFHIAPGESMIAGGVWHPDADNLAKIRQEIDYNADKLKKIVGARPFVSTFGEIKGEKLKKAPKGYDPDNPEIELLKFKDYLAYKTTPNKDVMGKDYVAKLIKEMKILYPFNNYLNEAVS